MMETNNAMDVDRRPWFVRHRMRALLLLFVSFLAFGAIVGTTVFVVFTGRVKASEPYRLALEQVEADAQVRQFLGQPLEPAWLTIGTVDGAEHYAEFTFRVKGPRGKGTVRSTAERSDAASPWRLTYLGVGLYGDFGEHLVEIVDENREQ